MFTMPFGKYAGMSLPNIPDDYLLWCLNTLHNMGPRLRNSIIDELGRRKRLQWHANDDDEECDRVPSPELVQRWYRELAMKFHPDRGGSHEAMLALNTAHERLLAMLNE